MGIKKVVRPINKAKNEFVEWLKTNNADNIDVFEGELTGFWDYYRSVNGFVGDTFYSVYFMMRQGQVKIDYSDGENDYNEMSVEEFLLLIN